MIFYASQQRRATLDIWQSSYQGKKYVHWCERLGDLIFTFYVLRVLRESHFGDLSIVQGFQRKGGLWWVNSWEFEHEWEFYVLHESHFGDFQDREVRWKLINDMSGNFTISYILKSDEQRWKEIHRHFLLFESTFEFLSKFQLFKAEWESTIFR